MKSYYPEYQRMSDVYNFTYGRYHRNQLANRMRMVIAASGNITDVKKLLAIDKEVIDEPGPVRL